MVEVVEVVDEEEVVVVVVKMAKGVVARIVGLGDVEAVHASRVWER